MTIEITEEIQALIDTEVNGLKAQNAKLIGEARTDKSRLDKVNIDLEDYAKLKEADVKRKEKDLKDKDDYAGLLELKETEHQAALAAVKADADKQRNSNRKLMIDSALQTAIAENDGNEFLLIDKLRSRTYTEENSDGISELRVKGEDGKVLMTAEGKPATVNDLVKNLKSQEKYGGAFNGTGARGSGGVVSPGSLPVGDENPWDPKVNNFTKQLEMIAADKDKAREMAKLHGKEF